MSTHSTHSELRSGVLSSPADAMLSEAIGATLQMQPEARAEHFERLVLAIQAFMAAHPEERPWTCTFFTGTDGSRVFRGGVGYSLVVDVAGRLWRARSYEDFLTTHTLTQTTCEIATLTPLYSQMRGGRASSVFRGNLFRVQGGKIPPLLSRLRAFIKGRSRL